MGKLLADTLQKLSRIFLGRVVVHGLNKEERAVVAVFKQEHPVAVHVVRSSTRVGAALFVDWKKKTVHTAGSMLGRVDHLQAKSVSLRLKENEAHRFSLRLSKKKNYTNQLWRIKAFPQVRKNRLSFLKNQPKIAKGTILALFSPVIKEWVQRSILDKSTGSLLLWYKADKVKYSPHHLLLVRVYGVQEQPLQWVWLPAVK